MVGSDDAQTARAIVRQRRRIARIVRRSPGAARTRAVSDALAVRRGRPAPRVGPSALSVGVVVWLASELMFFAGLFAAWFTLRRRHRAWPPEGVELAIGRTAAATVVLVASSFTMHLAVGAGRARRPARGRPLAGGHRGPGRGVPRQPGLEYAELDFDDRHPRLRLDLLPDDRVPRPPRARRAPASWLRGRRRRRRPSPRRPPARTVEVCGLLLALRRRRLGRHVRRRSTCSDDAPADPSRWSLAAACRRRSPVGRRSPSRRPPARAPAGADAGSWRRARALPHRLRRAATAATGRRPDRRAVAADGSGDERSSASDAAASCAVRRCATRARPAPTTSSPPAGCRWPTPTTSPAARSRPTTPAEIDALVAYVASLGDGPAAPRRRHRRRRPGRGRRALPGATARRATRHRAAAARSATAGPRPASTRPSPTEVGAAVRVGPGQMPVFGPDAIDRRRSSTTSPPTSSYLQGPRRPGRPADRPHRPGARGLRGLARSASAACCWSSCWIGGRSPIDPAARRGARRVRRDDAPPGR